MRPEEFRTVSRYSATDIVRQYLSQIIRGFQLTVLPRARSGVTHAISSLPHEMTYLSTPDQYVTVTDFASNPISPQP